MKRKNLLNKKGFTLIELIVVIAILAILALILVPSITGYIDKATTAKDVANARSLYSEVVLGVATGDITADGDRTLGDTTCSFTITGESVATFTCVDGDNASIALDFLSN